MSVFAPIVLFVYNRPWHTRMTLEALRQNLFADQSELFIYADGAKLNADKDQLGRISEVRQIIHEEKWCGQVNITESDVNRGLSESIISGVSEIINKFGKIIVLEDDLITGRGFLKYMNEALDLYENKTEVMHISGYFYPVIKKSLPETFFILNMSCWGWATWKRSWDMFEPDGKKSLNLLRETKLTRVFDLEGAYPYTRMLQEQTEGKIDSWAIRWYASIFLKNGLSLYPKKSLVRNTGHDSSGIHCTESAVLTNQAITNFVTVNWMEPRECARARSAIKQSLRFLYDTGFLNPKRLKNIFRKIIPRKIYELLKSVAPAAFRK